ncbi:MAG: hypothetical protein L6Q99_10385 [Planctomycetes bacterium]|nr:hypothetical protein [Planctomycetota bacterium]
MKALVNTSASTFAWSRWLSACALGLCGAAAAPQIGDQHPLWGAWALDGNAEEGCHQNKLNDPCKECEECAAQAPDPSCQHQDDCVEPSENTEDAAESFTANLPGGTVNTNREYVHSIEDYTVMHEGTSCRSCGGALHEAPIRARYSPFVLRLERTFQSRLFQPATCQGFGRMWQHNYDYQLEVHSTAEWTQVIVTWPGGPNPTATAWKFIDVGNTGVFAAQDATQTTKATLVPDGAAFLLTTKWGEHYHFAPFDDDLYVRFRPDWIEDKNGFRLTFTYDSIDDDIDRLERIQDGYGRALTFAWTKLGPSRHVVARVGLPDGREIRFEHESPDEYFVHYPNGDAACYARMVDAEGQFWVFNDARGNPGSRKHRVYVTASGQVRGIRDLEGRLLFVPREISGSQIRYEYANGESRTWGTNANGFPVYMQNDWTGAERKTSWDEYFRLVKSETDYLGHETQFTYVALELEGLKQADGTYRDYAYDARHLLVSSLDELGIETKYEYDAAGNVTKKTLAAGTPDEVSEEWTYDALGNVLSHTDARDFVTSYEYDAFGCVATVVLPKDADETTHPEWSFVHDVNGRPLSATDPDGWTTHWTYDDADRVTATTYADGTTEAVVYGTNGSDPLDPAGTTGLVLRRKDRNDHWVDNEYDKLDCLIGVTDSIGQVLARVYTPETGLLASEDRAGDVRTWTYDVQGRVSTETFEANASTSLTTTYAHDELDRVTTSTDPHGFETVTTYDSMGRETAIAREVAPSSFSTEEFGHDAKGRRIERTDPRGYLWRSQYDPLDRVITETDPLLHSRSYGYDANDNRIALTDEEGHTRTWTFTSRNRVKSETEPGPGNTLTYSYFPSDLVKQVQNAGTGGVTDFTYTCCGRLESRRIGVDGADEDIVERYFWDGNGNQIARVDGEGFVWRTEYDARDRVTKHVDPLTFETTYAYSDDGSPFDDRLAPGQGSAASVTDANLHTTTTVADGGGRRCKVIDAVGNDTQWYFDVLTPLGTVETSVVDRMGATTKQFTDGVGRIVMSVDELTHETEMAYDANGNLISVEDADDHVTTFTWDEANRKLTETYAEHDGDPNNDTVTFTWFDNGWLKSRKDQKAQELVYAYDPTGRRLSVAYPDATQDVFAYDAGGRLATATTGLYATGFPIARTYDLADRLTTETQSGKVIAYAWDRRSVKTRVTSPSGFDAVRTFTERGELDRVSAHGRQRVDHEYDPAGLLIRKALGNGAVTSMTYDARDWMTEIRHTAGTSDIQTFAYAFDAEGNKLHQESVTFPERSETYGYDAAHRLIQWKRGPLGGAPSKTQLWNLDALGNWDDTTVNGIVEDRDHNAVNELVRRDTVNLVYDDNGNLIDDGSTLYEWDYNDKLKRAIRKSDGFVLGEYAYDALGRRVRRHDHLTPEERLYFLDGDQVIEERNFAGTVIAHYVYGNYIDEPICRILVPVPPTPLPGALKPILASNVYYYHTNSLYSVAALSGMGGGVLERYEYDAYGMTTTYSVNWTEPLGSSRIANPAGFTGRTLDGELAELHFRSRSLAPVLGRFVTRDRLSQIERQSLYAASFVPNAVDPWGFWKLVKEDIWEAEVGDTLWSLAALERYGSHGSNWPCLWPTASTGDHGYPDTIWPGDCYDARNLAVPAPGAAELRLSVSSDVYAMGGRLVSTTQVGPNIQQASGEGGTPLSFFLLSGHGGASGMGGSYGPDPSSPGNSQWNDPEGGYFNAAVFGSLPDPAPAFDRAAARKGPKRCWFTRDAHAWFAGCNTSALAESFAGVALREGAFAHGTRMYSGFSASGIQWGPAVDWVNGSPRWGAGTRFSSNWQDPSAWNEFSGSL